MTANGMVLEALPGALFRLKMEDGRETLAYLSGKMRMNRIKVLPGDRVTVKVQCQRYQSRSYHKAIIKI